MRTPLKTHVLGAAFLAGLVCLNSASVAANPPPRSVSANETPSEEEQHESKPFSAADRAIRSARMMAMAEARVRAVRQFDPNSSSAKTTASANDTETPTFRTLARDSVSDDSKSDDLGSKSTQQKAQASASHKSDDPKIEVGVDVPTFDLADPAQRSALHALAPGLSLECSGSCSGKAFVGPFSLEAAKAVESSQSGSDRPTDPPVEVAIVRNGKLSLFQNGRTLDTVSLGRGTDSLPDKWRTLRAVRLVPDGTLQILCHWKEVRGAKSNRKSVVHAAVYKLVRNRIGQPFERVIAHRSQNADGFSRVGRYSFISRNEEPAIVWERIDADSDRTQPPNRPGTTTRTVLVWNPWEGVFRPPGPPPRAPEQRS